MSYSKLILPPHLRTLLASDRSVHIAAGVDAKFSGLHPYEGYEETPHAVLNEHQDGCVPLSLRNPTVVIPPTGEVWTYCPVTILHEWAHMLDMFLDFPDHTLTPVTEYAATDREETWAEAFADYWSPGIHENDFNHHPYVARLNRDDHRYMDEIMEQAKSLVSD